MNTALIFVGAYAALALFLIWLWVKPIKEKKDK